MTCRRKAARLNSARILAEKLFKVAGNGNGHLRRAKVGRLTRVSEGLVSTLNGRPVFSDAVSRVADSLSPLGAAARIFAESCALAVDLRELSLESRRIDDSREVTLTQLADRRATSSAALAEARTQLVTSS